MNDAIVKPPPSVLASRAVVLNPEPEQGIKLDLRRSLMMHRNLALLVFAIVAVALTIFGLSQKPQYLAKCLIYVQPATPKTLTDISAGPYDSSRYDSYIEQQLETIVRDDILADALKNIPPGMWRLPNESEQSAINRLRSSLKVQRVLSSFEVGISLSGRDPVAVTRVVNEVAAAFLRYGRGDETAQSDQQLRLLIADRERLLNALNKDRQEQTVLSSGLGVADTSSETTRNQYDAQLQQIRQQVLLAREAHNVAMAQLEAVSNGSESRELLNAASDEAASSDSGLNSLKSAITVRRSTLSTQMAGMTTANPIYKQDEQELARLDESLAKLSQGLRSKASQQLVGKWKLEAEKTGGVLAQLETQLAEQVSIATSAAPRLQRASDVTSDIERLQTRFSETDNAIHTLELQETSSGLAHLSLAAVQPQTPTSTRKQLILTAALPLALLCGILAAILRHKLDSRVYIAKDLEGALRFSPMAVLPDSSDVNSSVSNEFMLRLVAGIDQAHRVGKAKTFVFTAASPSMNTSTLVKALAQKMSVVGYKVAVSKASPALKSLQFNPDDSKEPRGLLTPVRGSDNTSFMGAKESNLILENMMQITRSVDMVFIDAKPILASAEAEFETRLVDVTVLLAGSGLTTRHELTSSLKLIRRLTSEGVATVLMNLRLKHADRDFLSAVHSAESTT